MRQLTGFTDQPRQESIITIDDGSRATLRLEYKPNQLGWFISITRGDFVLNGVRLVPSPNILRQWDNVIPFGLLVATNGNAEPINQSDLSNGFCGLYLLDVAEIVEVSDLAFPGLSSATSTTLLRPRFRPVAPVVVTLSFASIYAANITKYGISGYNDGGYDAGNPPAWSGHGRKWRNRALSGTMTRSTHQCSGCVGYPASGGSNPAGQRQEFSGTYSVDISGVISFGVRIATSINGDCNLGSPSAPSDVSTVFFGPSSEVSTCADSLIGGGSTAVTTLTSRIVTGCGCGPSSSSYVNDVGVITDTLLAEDTAYEAIQRAGPSITGTDTFAFTGTYGTNSPSGISPWDLDEAQSVEISAEVVGPPFVNYKLRIHFVNTIRSTGAPLAPSYLDVYLTTDSVGEWSDLLTIPEPAQGNRSQYSGLYEVTIA